MEIDKTNLHAVLYALGELKAYKTLSNMERNDAIEAMNKLNSNRINLSFIFTRTFTQMERILEFEIQYNLQPIDHYSPYYFLQRREFVTSFYGKGPLSISHISKFIAWLMVYGDKITIELKRIGNLPLIIKIKKTYKGIQIYLFDNIVHSISLQYMGDVKKIEYDLTYLFKNSFLI